ncbi:MAG: MerC domain-containing protein [Fimbriimonas ginsengisoli]|uniref:MerC domain-containing protein n=1 Tax=Fimbriimonas ginsengisoli TaxID=1005039 RepID=A0A931M232_FIMGI|nr:MerC domain-containing protein [Fimbriimonas ginsengisoli]
MAVGRVLRLNLDKVGACASAVCAVHCLLTGLALGLLSVVGFGFLGSLTADIAFLGVALSVGLLAVFHGIRRHHSLVPASVFVGGLVFIVLGHFVLPHPRTGEAPTALGFLSTAFSVLGGLCLVSFHIVNLWLQRHGGCGCESCRSHVPGPSAN